MSSKLMAETAEQIQERRIVEILAEEIGNNAQQSLDRLSKAQKQILTAVRKRMVKDVNRHAAFNSGVIAGIELAKRFDF